MRQRRYIFHLLNLMIALSDVRLIDTESVNPEIPKAFAKKPRMQTLKEKEQIFSNHKRLPIELNPAVRFIKAPFV
jgi:hypothetical protein